MVARRTGLHDGCGFARDVVVLASGSATRRAMLRRAGIAFEAQPPDIDEVAIKARMRDAGDDAEAIARTLACEKARAVSRQFPEHLVIGADQVLELDGRTFDKPLSRDDARDQLRRLSGRRHALVSCVCLAAGGKVLWHHVDRATLSVRELSDAFIETYLDAVGDTALDGPGAYRIEGLGAQLFDAVEGDHFTILGLPLLPLLGALRERGAVMA